MFNKPCTDSNDCVDVYDGCKVDYKGNDATAQNFLKILTGDASAGGKVLKSTSTDKVFVNFVDHGGSGIIAFPKGPYLHASDLVSSLKEGNTKSLWSKLVFYMEACESGSMFTGLLPSNINVFATTAADATEPSWGTYCPPNDKVNGKAMNTCLGDLYSVNWMEDSDRATASGNFNSETLGDQLTTVKKLTNKSHVLEFGDETFVSDTIAQFQAGGAKKAVLQGKFQAGAVDEAEAQMRIASSVDSRDIAVHLKFYEYMRATDMDSRHAASRALVAEVQLREKLDLQFHHIAVGLFGASQSALMMETPMQPNNFKCIKTANAMLRDVCTDYDDYSLKYSHILVNACEKGLSFEEISKALRSVCAPVATTSEKQLDIV
jgi:legumain